MNWWQVLLTIFLSNTIVLIPMILNGRAGTRYGIPFPVLARVSFVVLGANVPALLRAVIACGWFGIQTWIGGGMPATRQPCAGGQDWTYCRPYFLATVGAVPKTAGWPWLRGFSSYAWFVGFFVAAGVCLGLMRGRVAGRQLLTTEPVPRIL